MAKKSLLLVDADPKSARLLEVSLRKAGYNVTACEDGKEALATVELSAPDLIVADTELPGLDGFALLEALREREELARIPFVFLSGDSSVESKVRGLSLGVEDYLTKPFYLREILTRIDLTFRRKERDGLARTREASEEAPQRTRFTGTLRDMPLPDLLQTIEISNKSGVLRLRGGWGGRTLRGKLRFRGGRLLEASLGELEGEAAIYRGLLLSGGGFAIDFHEVEASVAIEAGIQALLMEGMRRVDEWGRLLEQVPKLEQPFEVVPEELLERLSEIPDEINPALRAIDEAEDLYEAIDRIGVDDLEALSTLTKLYFEGLIRPRQEMGGAEREEDRWPESQPPPAHPFKVPKPADVPTDAKRAISNVEQGEAVSRRAAGPTDASADLAKAKDLGDGTDSASEASEQSKPSEERAPPKRRGPRARKRRHRGERSRWQGSAGAGVGWRRGKSRRRGSSARARRRTRSRKRSPTKR